jgi:outer membrane lipoprotein SlyB
MDRELEDKKTAGAQIGATTGGLKGAAFGAVIGGPPGALLFGAIGLLKGAFWGSVIAEYKHKIESEYP